MASAVTSRYATALISLAEENKSLKKVEKDIDELMVMIEESDDLRALIASPSLGMAQQEAAMMALADKAKFQKITKNFIGVLVRNRRLSMLASVVKSVREELAKRRGEIVAQVQTAQAMSAKQAKELQASLSKSLGQDVQLDAKVQPEILGGMIVTVGSQMIDDSVARKLERLKAAMSAQANQNVSGASAPASAGDKPKTKSKSKSKTTTKKKEA